MLIVVIYEEVIKTELNGESGLFVNMPTCNKKSLKLWVPLKDEKVI